jgi:hypothetical protein
MYYNYIVICFYIIFAGLGELWNNFKEDTKRDFGIDFTKSYIVQNLIGAGIALLIMSGIFYASDVNNGLVKPFANEVVIEVEK